MISIGVCSVQRRRMSDLAHLHRLPLLRGLGIQADPFVFLALGQANVQQRLVCAEKAKGQDVLHSGCMEKHHHLEY